MTASVQTLQKLHDLVSKTLTETIASGKYTQRDTRNALRFLRNNGVSISWKAKPIRRPR